MTAHAPEVTLHAPDMSAVQHALTRALADAETAGRHAHPESLLEQSFMDGRQTVLRYALDLLEDAGA